MWKNFWQKSVLKIFILILFSNHFSKANEKEHTLVKINVPEGQYHDVLVMAIVNKNILIAECVQTNNPNTWIFTGPPGKYSIRVTSFVPDKGFIVTNDEKVISSSSPGPDPGPRPPGPGPGPGPFDNIAQKVSENISKFNNFPAKELSKIYLEAADKYEGIKQPIIPTTSVLKTYLLEQQAKIFTPSNEMDWALIRGIMNPYWANVENKEELLKLLREVARGCFVQ